MNLHEIDLRHLLALIAVEHEGSFGRAGERLGFSQSAISQQIAALERVVGRSMFDRPKGPRKITLTDAGKVMLNHAEAIVEQLRNADAELLELDSREAGTVRIGSFQSVSVALLPPTLVRIRRDRPSVVVVPSEIDDDEEMRRLLAAGDLDMAFLVGDADGRFDVIHVLTDPFCLIAPRSMDFGPTVNADLLRGMAMVGELPSSCQTHVERGEGPNVIEREDRERHITIWAFPQGRPLGEIAREMETSFAAIKMPPGTSYILDGQIRDMNESNESMGLALLLAVIFIYIVLASQFESFVHPFTIMLTLPLALVGAIIALFLWGTTLAMGAMIGIILLMGLVTKNAILLLDRALVRAREMGEPTETAILHAGPERLRPILMTSAAMILGMLPTALSNGDGSEFRAPMAVAVIGGVISSTFLSLIVVPAMYVSIENAKAWLARQFGLDLRGVHTVPPPPPGESEWGGE